MCLYSYVLQRHSLHEGAACMTTKACKDGVGILIAVVLLLDRQYPQRKADLSVACFPYSNRYQP